MFRDSYELRAMHLSNQQVDRYLATPEKDRNTFFRRAEELGTTTEISSLQRMSTTWKNNRSPRS